MKNWAPSRSESKWGDWVECVSDRSKHDGHMIIDILCLDLTIHFRPIRLGSDVIAVAVSESVVLRKKFSLFIL